MMTDLPPFRSGLFREVTRLELGERILIVAAAGDIDDLVLTDRDYEKPPYWAVLWPSSVGLARHLWCQRDLVRKVTLELGCGAGLAGIAARCRGARVLQTDLFPEAVALARWNARQNHVSGIRYLAMDWLAWSLRGQFDLILAADVLYERVLHAPLKAIFEENLAPRGEVWIADPGRPLALDFAAHMEAAGWRVAMETLPGGERPLYLYRLHRG
jgi:predicted nicotinamide N-methyase